MIKQLFTLLMPTVAISGLAQAADEINCTASPECATLGYTQTNCPKGGIRCPFDKTKMFCVSGFGGEDFSFKTFLLPYHVVFSDGTTGTFYNADKDPIGIVTYVHPNTQGNHGIIMALNQPPVETRDEAIKYCANYTTKGTKVGDWHLADIGELMTMQNGDLIEDKTQFNNINEVLKTIPGAQALGVSFSYYYSQKCSASAASLWVDCDISATACNDAAHEDWHPTYPSEYLNLGGYLNSWYTQKRYTSDAEDGDQHPMPGCANGNGNAYEKLYGGYPFYYSSSYWSMSDSIGSTSKPYVADIYQQTQVTTSTALRGHFRCMAIF